MDHAESTVHRLTRLGILLTFLSACWSAVSLLLLSALIAGSLALTALEEVSIATRPGHIVGNGIIFGLASLVMVALGMALGRFLLRAIPPLMNDGNRVRTTAVAFLVCSGFVALVGFSFLAAVESVSNRSRPVPDTPLLVREITAAIVPFALAWTIGALATVLRRYRNPSTFLERPYVLFLRRFSTFSDRAVIALVLRQVPSGIPVVFLSPTRSRPADWDPFIVGFAGLKLSHPLRSAPIVLRARDSHWQQAATELIRCAQVIIVDASHDTRALRTEAEMIGKADRWADTLCLQNVSSPFIDTVPPRDAFSRARHIGYTKSWIRAVPKLLIGAFVTVYSTVVLSVPLEIALSYAFPRWLILAAAVIAYSVFWRPAIDRKAKRALKRALRSVAST